MERGGGVSPYEHVNELIFSLVSRVNAVFAGQLTEQLFEKVPEEDDWQIS